MMSKLIFNPEKDMKVLLDYGFKLNDDEEYELVFEKDNIQVLIIVENEGTVCIQSNAFVIRELGVLYDLIKANLFIDEEELKDGLVDKESE